MASPQRKNAQYKFNYWHIALPVPIVVALIAGGFKLMGSWSHSNAPAEPRTRIEVPGSGNYTIPDNSGTISIGRPPAEPTIVTKVDGNGNYTFSGNNGTISIGRDKN